MVFSDWFKENQVVGASGEKEMRPLEHSIPFQNSGLPMDPWQWTAYPSQHQAALGSMAPASHPARERETKSCPEGQSVSSFSFTYLFLNSRA